MERQSITNPMEDSFYSCIGTRMKTSSPFKDQDESVYFSSESSDGVTPAKSSFDKTFTISQKDKVSDEMDDIDMDSDLKSSIMDQTFIGEDDDVLSPLESLDGSEGLGGQVPRTLTFSQEESESEGEEEVKSECLGGSSISGSIKVGEITELKHFGSHIPRKGLASNPRPAAVAVSNKRCHLACQSSSQRRECRDEPPARSTKFGVSFKSAGKTQQMKPKALFSAQAKAIDINKKVDGRPGPSVLKIVKLKAGPVTPAGRINKLAAESLPPISAVKPSRIPIPGSVLRPGAVFTPTLIPGKVKL